jgi:competence protein ComEA
MLRKLIATVFATLALVGANVYAAVDVNRASQAELEQVKGIGPGLSGKIIKAREAGSFKDWGDFVGRVGGVGNGNAAKFSQAGLTVGGSAFDASKLPAATKAPRKAAKTDAPAAEKAANTEKAAPKRNKKAEDKA